MRAIRKNYNRSHLILKIGHWEGATLAKLETLGGRLRIGADFALVLAVMPGLRAMLRLRVSSFVYLGPALPRRHGAAKKRSWPQLASALFLAAASATALPTVGGRAGRWALRGRDHGVRQQRHSHRKPNETVTIGRRANQCSPLRVGLSVRADEARLRFVASQSGCRLLARARPPRPIGGFYRSGENHVSPRRDRAMQQIGFQHLARSGQCRTATATPINGRNARALHG